MKTYNNVAEMAAATEQNVWSPQSVDNERLNSTCNVYGYDVPTSSDRVGQITVSINVQEMDGKLSGSAKELATWDEVKRNPVTTTLGILGTAPNYTELDAFEGSLNLGTGELILGGGAKGSLPKSPADVVKEHLEECARTNKRPDIPVAIEKAVWQYVDSKINDFWKENNEQSD